MFRVFVFCACSCVAVGCGSRTGPYDPGCEDLVDADDDGFWKSNPAFLCCDDDCEARVDCNDDDASINPDAADGGADGVDSNCDGAD